MYLIPQPADDVILILVTIGMFMNYWFNIKNETKIKENNKLISWIEEWLYEDSRKNS